MAPVSNHCISVAKFSSQDPVHKAENILRKDAGKWLSHKDDHSTQIEAEIHLTKTIKIGFINVGNAGSAFIELLVGSSMWPSGKDYVTLLPSQMLMSPADSKTGKNNSGVKMFDEGAGTSSIVLIRNLKQKLTYDHKIYSYQLRGCLYGLACLAIQPGAFAKGVADSEWDRLRVICRQPFARRKQFGLQFVDIIEDDKLSNSETDEESKISPKQSLAAFRNKLQVRSSNTRPRLSSPNSCQLSSPPSSHAAGLVQAALKGQGKPKQQVRFDVKQQERKHQRHNNKVKRGSPYQVNAQLQRKKTLSRRSAGDIEDEVESFLEEFDFDKLPFESITYRHLKEKMEDMRGCQLNKAERKIFLRLAEKHVLEVIDRRKDLQKKAKENILEVNSTEDKLEGNSVIDLSSPISTKSSPSVQSHTPLPKSSSPPNRSPTTLPESVDPAPFSPSTLQECPICQEFFPREIIEFHASTCVGASTCETITNNSPVKTSAIKDSKKISCCPVCNRWFPASKINVHVNICVDAERLTSC